MPPNNDEGRPAQGALTVDANSTTTDTTRITRRRRKPPQAYASLFAPHPGRDRWLITFVCPRCKFGHRALADTEDKARGYRTRCRDPRVGGLVSIRVARTYRGSNGARL